MATSVDVARLLREIPDVTALCSALSVRSFVQRLTAVARNGHDVKSGSKKAADGFQKRDVIVS
jgi:hypothetical protein